MKPTMYLQLTTRCNMHCDHCCFACTEEGEDMLFDTFIQALDLAKRRNRVVWFGGGEPTVHPLFVEFVNIAVRMIPGAFGVTTNGKIAGRATFLAGLAKKGLLTAVLSQDRFHEPVSNEVVQAFHNLGAIQNGSQARRNPRHIVGREMQRRHILQRPKKDPCVCPGVFVKPDGRVMQCACPDAPVMGRIGRFVPDIMTCCHRSKRFREAAMKVKNQITNMDFGMQLYFTQQMERKAG